jgi:hypothetical protein
MRVEAGDYGSSTRVWYWTVSYDTESFNTRVELP